MGFYAAELAAILQAHVTHPGGSPWSILTRLGVHPQQIDRLKKAHDEIAQVSSLQQRFKDELTRDLELSPRDVARLAAAEEADAVLRILMYHNYPLDEAANRANAVFATLLKDRLAAGGRSTIYAPGADDDAGGIGPDQPPKRRDGDD